MSSSVEDEKHEALIEKCGMEGYGAYWVVAEKIAAQIRPECVSTSLTLSWRNWARHLRTSTQKTQFLLRSMDEARLVLLTEINGSVKVDMPNILKYADEYTRKLLTKSRQTPDKLPTNTGSPAVPALPAVPEEQDLKPIAPTPEKDNGSGSKPKAWVNLISWNRDKGCFEGITPEIVEKWEKAYPAVDLNSQLNRADEWLKANPTKQKSNYYRFVINWLSRAQERGGR
jgi:hypothetical protein